mgnify:CR=1 FL=1
MAISIRIGKGDEGESVTLELKARKSLDGNILMFMDLSKVLFLPQKMKILIV